MLIYVFLLQGQRMGLSKSVIGLLFSTAALMGVVMSPLTGYVVRPKTTPFVATIHLLNITKGRMH